MLGYLIRRVLASVPVMGVVALFVFLLLRLTPGDPAAIIAGDVATPEQLDRIRTSLGLNEPLYEQFITWLGKILHGDLGVSLISNVPVLSMIGQRLEPTISIALTTIILVRDLVTGGARIGFEFQIILWLWFTVLFANFAEAIAEGRGKAQADALRRQRIETRAKLITGSADSRMTGALSPVMADSSTLAMPSITSPSPGMVSPCSTRQMSPARS